MLDYPTLKIIWWLLIGVLLVGFAVMDGHDMGVATLLGSQAIINLGVILGLMPTAGIPLPLMSYGGSSLVTSVAALGLVLNVRMRCLVN